MEEYEKKIEEMTRQLVLWETEQSKSLEVQRQMDAVVGRWQNLELLLISEKEESRVLRNKVSQQSQILDDLRIQLAMSEGRGPGAMPATPTIEFQSEDESHSLARGSERDEDDGMDVSRGDEGDNDDTEDDQNTWLVRRVSSRSKATGLRHRNGDSFRRTADMGWPSTFSRSNSNQTGFDQQRRAEAVQELMVREKVRWDQELQQAHNRLSREAVRNQQLEDRILELQGQLEMARAIDMRNMPGFGGGHGGGLGHHGGGGLGEGGPGGGHGGSGIDHAPRIHMEGPSQPVHFPSTPGGNDGIMRSHLDLHHNDGSTEGGDTDDGGSTGMIGRYSQRQRDDDDDGFSDPRIRSMGQGQPFESYHGSDAIPPRPPGYPSQVGSMSSSSRLSGKGKSTSSSNLSSVKGTKSRSKWLQAPTTLERAQTDSGPFGGVLNIGTSSHLGGQGSGTPRKSGDSTSTAGSSSTATRATTGGLYPPMNYTRNMSHRSDGGSSDVTTASDSSATGHQRTLRGRGIARPVSDSELGIGSGVRNLGEAGGSTPGGSRSGSRSGSAASGSTSGGASKKSGRSKEDKEERDRERDKIRLMGTMGPLVDPSKMYRNVRMF